MSSTPVQEYAVVNEVKFKLNISTTDTSQDDQITVATNDANNYIAEQTAVHASVVPAGTDPSLSSMANNLAAAYFNFWISTEKDREELERWQDRIQQYIMATYGIKSANMLSGEETFGFTTGFSTTTTGGGSGNLISPLSTKGDIWGFDTANARIPVGATGFVLTANPTDPLGVSWQAVAGTGNVVGPNAATDNAIVRYDGISGNLIQNSGIIIDDLDNVTGVTSIAIGDGTWVISEDGSDELLFTSPTGNGDHGIKIVSDTGEILLQNKVTGNDYTSLLSTGFTNASSSTLDIAFSMQTNITTTSDSGTEPIIQIQGKANSGTVGTRPIIGFYNFNTKLLELDSNGTADFQGNTITNAVLKSILTDGSIFIGDQNNASTDIPAGLEKKDDCRVATTANIDLSLPVDPNPVDGVNLVDDDRILLKNQTNASENGIYDTILGDNPTTWNRSSDANISAEVNNGMFTVITEGNTNANTPFVLSTPDIITLNITNLAFQKFSFADLANLNSAQTFIGIKTFGETGDVGKLAIAGTTSGITILDATAIASGTLTLPAATDVLVARDTTDILTNKTLTTPTIGSFQNAAHNHQGSTGGATLLSTAALSDTANIAYLNTANTYIAGNRQDFLGLLAGNAGLNVGGIAGNPGAQVDGDIWLNTLTNQIFARINNADVDLVGITSINTDTTPAQTIAGTANLITVGTISGTTTINVGTNVALLDAVQTFTESQTIATTTATDLILTPPTAPIGTASEFIANLAVSSGTIAFATTDQTGDFIGTNFAIQTLTNPTNPETIVNAATLRIAGEPLASTNVTITNNAALHVESGLSRFDGNIQVGSGNTINDSNGNKLIVFPSVVTSAVNEITISNAITGVGPTITSSGESNIDLNIAADGTGNINLLDSVVVSNATKTNLILTPPTAPTGSASEFIANLAVSSGTIAFATTDQTGDFIGTNFAIQTLTNPSSGTITDAATLRIAGEPLASTNVTITNNAALHVESGLSRFDGNIQVGSGSTINDSNGNKLIVFPSAVTSAVNEITISNAITGVGPTITSSGESNIDLNIAADGTGNINLLDGVVVSNATKTNLTLTPPTAPTGSASEFIANLAVSSGTIAFATTDQTGDFIGTKLGIQTLTNPTNPETIVNAATLRIVGAPVASTNVTITNNAALHVESGLSRFDGNIQVGSGSTINDSNGNELIVFPSTVASAVNEITISNTITGVGPTITSSGESNIDLNIAADGTGNINLLDDVVLSSRLQELKGADVVSSATPGTITLVDGNYFDVTGTTDIDFMITTNWQSGSVVTLQFDEILTVKNATAGAISPQADFALAGGVDFISAAGNTLTLVFDGADWLEIARNKILVPTSGQIIVGNTTVPEFVTMSGNATIDNTGKVTVNTGLITKTACRVASTANIDLTVVLDPSPVDGVTLANNDRILLKDQSIASQNGIYVTVTADDPTSWVRSADANENSEVFNGIYTDITEGIKNKFTRWVLVTPNFITLNTDSLTFDRFPIATFSGIWAGGWRQEDNVAANRRLPLTGTDKGNATFTERAILAPVDLTLSNFTVTVESNDGDLTFVIEDTTGNRSSTITFSSGATGTITNVTNSDDIIAGNLVAVRISASSVGITAVLRGGGCTVRAT